jgi:hypothetical protein
VIYAKLFALALYLGYLVWCGFRRRAGFASWHMFAGVSVCRFDLWEPTPDGQKRYVPWRDLPHTFTAMGRSELLVFLRYLYQVRRLRLSGHVTSIEEDTRTLVVREGRPVA